MSSFFSIYLTAHCSWLTAHRRYVLRNEALRLKDMTLIPAIQPNQVNEQVDKIIMVFNSYTQKVNTIYNKKKFDEEIDLDAIFQKDF